jgi:hypothetical protein
LGDQKTKKKKSSHFMSTVLRKNKKKEKLKSFSASIQGKINKTKTIKANSNIQTSTADWMKSIWEAGLACQTRRLVATNQ